MKIHDIEPIRINQGDTFDLEINENELLIRTSVLESLGDVIILEADNAVLELLESRQMLSEDGLGYSNDPAQAKWYHEGRQAHKGGTHGATIQDIAKKHGCPPEWLDAFREGYRDQESWSKQGVAEGIESQYMAARYIDEFGDGDHWYVKGTPDVIKKFVLLANSLEDEAVKGTEYELGKGMMAGIHAELGNDTAPQWTTVPARNLESIKPIGDKVLQRLMRPNLADGAQEFMSELLWAMEAKGLALVHDDSQPGVAEGTQKKPNATTRHLRDYPVSNQDVAKPVKKPEEKKPKQSVSEANGGNNLNDIVSDLAYRVGASNAKNYMKTPQQVGDAAIADLAKNFPKVKTDADLLKSILKGLVMYIENSGQHYTFTGAVVDYLTREKYQVKAWGANPTAKAMWDQGLYQITTGYGPNAEMYADLETIGNYFHKHQQPKKLVAPGQTESVNGLAEEKNPPLGKPMRGDVRKYKVYVKNPKTGKIKKVNFGDPNMEIKRDDPARRKSFRARHGCGTSRASDRTKAAYWSCRMWSSKPVSKILKGK